MRTAVELERRGRGEGGISWEGTGCLIGGENAEVVLVCRSGRAPKEERLRESPSDSKAVFAQRPEGLWLQLQEKFAHQRIDPGMAHMPTKGTPRDRD